MNHPGSRSRDVSRRAVLRGGAAVAVTAGSGVLPFDWSIRNAAGQGTATPVAPATPAPDAPIIQLDSGPIAGIRQDDAMRFNGIPYAAPPVGPLRWVALQPVASWSTVRPPLRMVRFRPRRQLRTRQLVA